MQKNHAQMLTDISRFICTNREIDGCEILEMLWLSYADAYPINYPVIRDAFRELDRIISVLPLQDGDQIMDLTCNLCFEHGKNAFLDGLSLGVQLMDTIRNQK